MSKKSRPKYISKGERVSVSRSLTKAVRRDMRQNGNSLARLLNQMDAHKKGKKTKLTDSQTQAMGGYRMKNEVIE